MLMGLSDMGLGANVFDAVYGASAGAINSTYYLSGEQHFLAISQCRYAIMQGQHPVHYIPCLLA
jgi:predicted patatin/cPLA2 family phospholipase